MKRVLLLLIGLAFACGCDRPSRQDVTLTAIGETFVRIDLYAQTNRAIPQSLDVLPRRAGYDNRTTDGWHRPLQFDLSQDGIITLRSLGADGKPGGDAVNVDISRSYHSKRPDGSLWVGGDPAWIVDAEIYPQLDGAANRSQPVSSDTNQTSRTAGSGR